MANRKRQPFLLRFARLATTENTPSQDERTTTDAVPAPVPEDLSLAMAFGVTDITRVRSETNDDR